MGPRCEIESCQGLEGIDVASDALLSCSITQCPNLTGLVLRKPNQWRKLTRCVLTGCRGLMENTVVEITSQCPHLKQLELQGTGVANLWSGKQHADAAQNKRRRQWQGRGKEPQGSGGKINTRTRAGLDRIEKQMPELHVNWI